MSDEEPKGEVLRDAKGRWIVAPPSAKPITHANAREMAAKRWAKYRQAAADAVTREASSIGKGNTRFAAWGELNARMYQQIMDSDKPREQAVALLGRNIGAIPREDEVAQAGRGGDTVALAELGREVLGALMGELQRRRAQVVEAEAEDVD